MHKSVDGFGFRYISNSTQLLVLGLWEIRALDMDSWGVNREILTRAQQKLNVFLSSGQLPASGFYPLFLVAWRSDHGPHATSSSTPAPRQKTPCTSSLFLLAQLLNPHLQHLSHSLLIRASGTIAPNLLLHDLPIHLPQHCFRRPL